MKNKKKVILSCIIIILVITCITISVVIFNNRYKIVFNKINYDDFLVRMKEELKKENIDVLDKDLFGEKIKEKLYRIKIDDKTLCYIEITKDNLVKEVSYIFDNTLKKESILKYISNTLLVLLKNSNIEDASNLANEIFNVNKNDGKDYSILNKNDVYISKVEDNENTAIFIYKEK